MFRFPLPAWMRQRFLASRSAPRRNVSRCRKRASRPAINWYRPRLEPLEDRTLLSVGGELNTLFGGVGGLQAALNGHLLQPSVSYSLPLVGNNLFFGSDTRGQFLSKLGAAVQNETNNNNLQNDLAGAPVIGPGTVHVTLPSGPSSSQDGEINIFRGQVTNLLENFDLGLPGLEKPIDPISLLPKPTYISQLLQTLTSQINVNVTLTYDLNLFFNFDSSGNVALDSSRNSPTLPLVSLDLQATVQPFSLSDKLGPLTVTVQPGPNGMQLNFKALQFNVASGAFNADFRGGNSNVTFGNGNLVNGASAVIDIALIVKLVDDQNNPLHLPGLIADLDVTWTPAAGTLNPFDNNSLGGNEINQKDLKASFDVSLNLSSMANFINPIIDGIRDKLAPLRNVVTDVDHVLNDPIPILSDLIPGTTLADLLSNPALNALAGTDLTSLKTLANDISILKAILNWPGLNPASSTIHLASINFFDADPRLPGFSLVDAINGLQNLFVTDPDPNSPFNSLQNSLNGLLPGLQIPLLTDPLTDVKALLGENVVLVRSTLGFDFSFNTTLTTIPIVPPLVLKIGVVFDIHGALTLGYDTYGFTSNWNSDPTNNGVIGSGLAGSILEGLFVEDAHLDLSGGITLTPEADLGIIQVGGTGKLELTFGINGLHEEVLDQPTKMGIGLP